MKPSQFFATSEPIICAVCWDRAVWLGYTTKAKYKPIWLCKNPECHAVGEKVYHMSVEQYDAYVCGASVEGVNAQGEFMSELGKFDLRELSELELQEFGKRYFVAFAKTMRHRISTSEAPSGGPGNSAQLPLLSRRAG